MGLDAMVRHIDLIPPPSCWIGMLLPCSARLGWCLWFCCCCSLLRLMPERSRFFCFSLFMSLEITWAGYIPPGNLLFFSLRPFARRRYTVTGNGISFYGLLVLEPIFCRRKNHPNTVLCGIFRARLDFPFYRRLLR